MIFREGATARTAEGEEIGTLDRVVVDPRTYEVTHVIILKGILFKEDKVVPIDMIKRTNEDELVLREGAGDLEALPDFKQQEYVMPDEQDLARKDYGAVRPVLYTHPYPGDMTSIAFPADVMPQVVRHTVENIPEGALAVRDDASVIGLNGNKVGKVKELLTEPGADRVTHFVLAEGVLFGEEKLIPIHWVSDFTQDEIHLAVNETILDQLEPYEG